MPHVIVKLTPGRTEDQKARLSAEITQAVVNILGCGEGSVSVSMEEVGMDDWKKKVYTPDIIEMPEKLYKKPGYTM